MEEEDVKPPDHLYILIGMLSVFSIIGVFGNGLVLYGFSKAKPKQTSTIFILTLACIDFVTCLLSIPAIIVMEDRFFRLSSDIACKFYHFLLTTTMPFSAFIMVAIAFDRYFCICHPLRHIMNKHRAGVIVFCLSMLALVTGVLTCLHYGVEDLLLDDQSSDACDHNITESDLMKIQNYGLPSEGNQTFNCQTAVSYCVRKRDVLFPSSTKIFEQIYSSFYAICVVVVIVLYIIIYKFILSKRTRRLRTESFQCCSLTRSPLCDAENTEIICMSSDVTQVQSPNNCHEKETACQTQQRSSLLNKEHTTFNAELSAISRQREERIRINNIKTAFMLSVVAFVFILAFLPAWLMKLELVPPNLYVFYLHFIYNLANPFIYAFMNPEFQQRMGMIVRDLKKRWSLRGVWRSF